MAVFVVTYRYDASPRALTALRPERYEYFMGLQSQGQLLASGQLFGGDLGEGMLVLDAASERAARDLLEADPFLREGYVCQLNVMSWNPTIGSWVV